MYKHTIPTSSMSSKYKKYEEKHTKEYHKEKTFQTTQTGGENIYDK